MGIGEKRKRSKRQLLAEVRKPCIPDIDRDITPLIAELIALYIFAPYSHELVYVHKICGNNLAQADNRHDYCRNGGVFYEIP